MGKIIPQSFKKRIIHIAKIILLTMFFTFLWILLFYNEKTHTPSGDHEKNEEAPTINQVWTKSKSTNKDEVDKEIETIIEDVLHNEHNVASIGNNDRRLQKICETYSDICNKTLRDQQYTPEQRLFYQGIIVYLISKLDKSLESGSIHNPGSIHNTLSYIRLYEDNGGRRGSAGHDYIKLNTGKIASWSESREVLTHELGHITDLGVIQGISRKKDSQFTEFGKKQWSIDDPSLKYYRISWQSENTRNPGANRLDFVSGYAMKGVYEDLAEGFNLYLNHYAIFKKLAQSNEALARKFDYFQDLLGAQPLQYGENKAKTYPSDKRDWDTTKIRN